MIQPPLSTWYTKKSMRRSCWQVGFKRLDTNLQVSSWPEADALGELVLLRSIRHTSGCHKGKGFNKGLHLHIDDDGHHHHQNHNNNHTQVMQACEGSRPMMQEQQANRAEFSKFAKSVNSNADVLSMRLLTSGHIALGGSSTVRRTKS